MKKQNKTLTMVDKLRKKGHSVSVRKRTDGGYLITEIDGVKYSGAKGNTKARQLTGSKLTEKQVSQMRENVNKYIEIDKTKPTRRHKAKGSVDVDLIKELRRVQRKVRESGKSGKVTKRKLRYFINTEGTARAREYLDNMYTYYSGIAYDDNVEWLAEYIEGLLKDSKFSNPQREKLTKLADNIREMTGTFKEEWINVIYSYLYDIAQHRGSFYENITKIYDTMK